MDYQVRDQPPGQLTGVVIIGAGLAGISAAEQLRALGYEGRLTIIGAEATLPYDRPPLSKEFLLGNKTAAQIRLRPATWYDEQHIDLRLGVAATEIRSRDREIVLSTGSPVTADAILLATGGRPRTLAVPGADHAAVLTLRTLSDAQRLRERLLPGIRLGVVGGGLVGAEVTAAAVALGCSVTLIDPVPRPLARVVGPDIADALHSHHREHGVRLIEGTVSAVADAGAGVTLRLQDSATTVDCDVVVVGVGIVQNVSVARTAGIAVDGAVLADAATRTSHPRIFAAGDVARTRGPDGGLLPPSEHWDGALTSGRIAAAAILGQPLPAPRTSWFWSDRYHTHLEVIGQFLDAETTVVRGELGTESFVALAIRDGRCVGAAAVNRASEMKAVRRLVERGVPVNLDELADDSVDLRALARARPGR